MAMRWRIALGLTALKFDSKCSFTNHKLRFFDGFCLDLPALMTFFNVAQN